MNNILQVLDIKPLKYEKRNNITIVDTKDKKYVLKKITNKDIYKYLRSRNFNNIPSIRIIDDYEIYDYIEDIEIPKEQKLNDLVSIVSLLHEKTTYTKDINSDEYKKIYEDLLNNIEYTYNYYSDMMTIIESKIYMSPSEYLLARNISKVFIKLDELKIDVDEWYSLVENKTTIRNSLLHNNLELNHLVNNYLISWDKSKKDMPILDLYKMYKKNNLTNIDKYLKTYEIKYPLENDEKKLLYILIGLPDIIEFADKEYLNTIKVRQMLDSIKIDI